MLLKESKTILSETRRGNINKIISKNNKKKSWFIDLNIKQ